MVALRQITSGNDIKNAINKALKNAHVSLHNLVSVATDVYNSNVG